MKNFFPFLVLGSLLLIISGCESRRTSFYIELPPTHLKSLNTSWAVIDYPMLNIRTEPKRDADQLTMLRAGTIVEVLSFTNEMEEIEEKMDRWYQIQHLGMRGWAFGAYIRVYDNVERAREAARSLLK